MADFTWFAVLKMTGKLNSPRFSFDLTDEKTALHWAQKIANACGGTVKVTDATGGIVGRAIPQRCVSQHRDGAQTIASIKKLADGMNPN
jgi:hypothetical protein